MYDDIVKYIPYGRENAISRDDLAIKVRYARFNK